MPDDLTDRVIGIIAETQHLDREKVTIDSSFADLNIDSLDGMQILFALENEFDINIPDDDVRTVRNVRQMCEGVAKLVAAKSTGAAS